MTIAPHRGVDAAVQALLNRERPIQDQAVLQIQSLVERDAHAALYLNLVAPQFYKSLDRDLKRGIAEALVLADERIAETYPASAPTWGAAAEHCRVVVTSLGGTAPPPVAPKSVPMQIPSLPPADAPSAVAPSPTPTTGPPVEPTPPVLDTAARRATRGMFG